MRIRGKILIRPLLAGLLIAGIIVGTGSACLKFQESSLDSTGAAAALPAFFFGAAGNTMFTVSGTLRDPDGSKVANTSLNITARTGGATTTAGTDSNGDFTTQLAAGIYDFAFSFNSNNLDLALTVDSAGASTGTSTTGTFYLDSNRASQVSFLAVAVGQNGSTCKYWYSTDLLNWTVGNMPTNLDTCSAMTSIVHANGVFVAVGATGTSRCYTAYSTDGINWTQTVCPPGAGSSSLRALTHGNGLFVGVGQYDSVKPTMRVSSDNGLSWSEIDPAAGSAQDWDGILYNGTKFFALESSVGPASQVYESSDPIGSSFAPTGGGCANSAAAITRDGIRGPGFKYVFTTNLAAEGSIFYNGTSCTVANGFSTQEGNLQGVAYDPLENRFAMIGLNCLTDTSTNGTTWAGPADVNTGSCAPTINFRAVRHSLQLKEFIAVGQRTTALLPQVARSTTGASNSWTVSGFLTGGVMSDDPRAIAFRE